MQRSWALQGQKPNQEDKNQEATVYVGNLDDRTTDGLLWELFLQCGPVVNIFIPKDRVTQSHQGFGFVEFSSEDDAEYAARIMNQVKLFGKAIRVNKASADKRQTVDIGAELFIGNLDPSVNELTLYDTFSAFGPFASAPSIMRDENGVSRGYGFISYTSFKASDAARDGMHSQFLANKPITVEYAFKKDTKGERHGSREERMLEEEARKRGLPIQPGYTMPQIPPTAQQQQLQPQQQQQQMPQQYPPGFAPPPGYGAPAGQPQQMPPGFGGISADMIPPPPPGFGSGPPPPPGSGAGYGIPGYGAPPPAPPGFNNPVYTQ